jgi:HrpA-like RNA helicase
MKNSIEEKGSSTPKKKQKTFHNNVSTHNVHKTQHCFRQAPQVVGKRKKERDAITAALPIFQYEKQLVECVRTHQTTIVVGETGSGK